MAQSEFLFDIEGGDSQREENLIDSLRPELNRICFNSTRSAILHSLFNCKELGYCMSVEEMSYKLGKRHSVILYHLEKLSEWNLVTVVKKYNYGNKTRRSVWGLNSRFPKLVSEVYSYMINTFFTKAELNSLCNVNKNVRKAV